MKKYLTFYLIISFFTILFAQQDLLQSGPMVGYSTMREVMLWVQTTERAKVQFVYWDKNDASQKYKTDEVLNTKENAFTSKSIADNVEPGITYEYQLLINGKPIELNYRTEFQTQKLWQWREDPPEFTFGAGSCAYINEEKYDRPGKPYGGEHQIFKTIYEKDPDFFVWMGDDLYLREADWNSWTGIVKRYTHDRSFPGLQAMIGSMHNYATWDDHDYGPNNSNRSFWAKKLTKKAFELFWPNPSFGVNGAEDAITTFFQWGDCDFFLMDDRTYRVPEEKKFGDRPMLGDAQIKWLVDALMTSKAPFKFVVIGSQVLNPVPAGENYSNYEVEKTKLLKAIKEEGIEGVIFLSGDIHRGELTKIDRGRDYPLYDFTFSPLTAGVSSYKGPNPARVEGTRIMDRNFGLFKVTGPRKNRVLKCTAYDADGSEQWTYTINENELKIKKK